MLKEFTCIICPNGCCITAETDGSGKVLKNISGALCKKGEEYVNQEITAPMRCIATSVPVENGDMPLCSVRLNHPIPRDRIFDAMKEIRKLRPEAPIITGTVLLHNILGFDSDVIATRDVESRTI